MVALIRIVPSCVIVHLWLVAEVSTTPVGEERIIGGSELHISDAPFVAALMDCTTIDKEKKCKFFCSGVLVSPNAVVTAGHCLERYGELPGHPSETTPIGRLHVMIGGDDFSQWRSAKLIQAKEKYNKGFGTSIRFPNDNDVGIVILDECLVATPGKIEFLKMSALHDEVKCGSEVEVFGFGSATNLERDVFGKGNKKLKRGLETLHSIHVCHQVYLQSRMAEQITIRGQSVTRIFKEAILSDTYLCASAAESAICYGDSGGAVVSRHNGERVLVGVTAFNTLIDGKKMCGGGLDYLQRISAHAEWIYGKLAESSCLDPQSSFVRWPVSLHPPSKKLLMTRCTGDNQWQCATGQCVSKDQHCDGIKHCTDGSDELYCKNTHGNEPTIAPAEELGGNIVNARMNPVQLRLCLMVGSRIGNLAKALEESPPKMVDGDYEVSGLHNACRMFADCGGRTKKSNGSDLERKCSAVEEYVSFSAQRKFARNHRAKKFPNECSRQQDLDFDDLVSDFVNTDSVDWTAVAMTIVGIALIALLVIL